MHIVVYVLALLVAAAGAFAGIGMLTHAPMADATATEAAVSGMMPHGMAGISGAVIVVASALAAAAIMALLARIAQLLSIMVRQNEEAMDQIAGDDGEDF